MSVESYYHGLRPLSIVFVVPHALAIHSAVCFNVALVGIAMEQTRNLVEGVVLVAVLALACLAIFGTFTFFNGSPSGLIFHLERALETVRKAFRTRKGRPRSDEREE